MKTHDTKKEKGKGLRSKKNIAPYVSYCISESVPETDIQSILDSAFDILFEEVFNNLASNDK
jgi:hypothetical protein